MHKKTGRGKRIATTAAASGKRSSADQKIHVSDDLVLEAISAVGSQLPKVREYLLWRHVLEVVPRGVSLSIGRR